MSHRAYIEHNRRDIPLKAPVGSLCWRDDVLIDWVGGNRVFDLAGGVTEGRVSWGYRFDAVVGSPSGRFAALYERYGTKAIILDSGKFLRELNRSFYCADDYEYPLAFFWGSDGRELLAHCPEEYNRLEIEEVATGQRLTGGVARKPDDFFHSRLAVSPDGGRLLSAGWMWHPFNSISIWTIAEALADGSKLDTLFTPVGIASEVDDACFLDADRLLLSSNPEAGEASVEGRALFRPGNLGVFNLKSAEFETVAQVDEPVGTMMWLDEHRVVGFYENPKVFDVRTGKVIFRWPDIATSKQLGSINSQLPSISAIAVDRNKKRFAVGSAERISVVEF